MDDAPWYRVLVVIEETAAAVCSSRGSRQGGVCSGRGDRDRIFGFGGPPCMAVGRKTDWISSLVGRSRQLFTTRGGNKSRGRGEIER